MRQLKPVDVVIAGGGFVGLTLAKAITARTSLSVVVLERGLPRKLSDYAAGMDELDLCAPLPHDAKPGGGNRHAPALHKGERGADPPVRFLQDVGPLEESRRLH